MLGTISHFSAQDIQHTGRKIQYQKVLLQYHRNSREHRISVGKGHAYLVERVSNLIIFDKVSDSWPRQVFGDRGDKEYESEEEDSEQIFDDKTSFANIMAMVNDQALPIQSQALTAQSQTQADSQYEINAFPDLQDGL